MSHVIYATRGLSNLSPSSLPPFLPWYTGLARLFGIAFLIYFGYMSHWYFAVILFVIGYVGQFILVSVETKFGFQKWAWAISLTGILVLPIVLVYMFYVAVNFQSV